MDREMTIPNKLRRIARKHRGIFHKIANDPEIKVNVAHVYRLLKYGIEPKRADIRQALGFHRRKPNPPSANHSIWWKSLPREVKSNIIRNIWIQMNSLTGETAQLLGDGADSANARRTS
jgi:hypothetical protein